jgi:transposase
MEITQAQFAQIKTRLPIQRGSVNLSNLNVVKAILYVAEHDCKWRAFSSALATGTPFTGG